MIYTRESVLQAIEECDQLGREEFRKKYGFRESKNFVLLHDGKEYDSKAIVGIAYGHENLSHGPRQANEFSGGEATVRKWLETLGFQIKVIGREVNAYILTWNPTKWTWEDFDRVVEKSQSGEVVVESWSTGNNRSIQPGDRVFLLRQSSERGLIGAGYSTSEVYTGPHWDGSDKEARYAYVDFETILPVEDVLRIKELESAKLGINWNRIQASGISVPADSLPDLETIWLEHLTRLGRALETLPSEVVAPARYIEGALRTISVNAYERNPTARRACTNHWGLDCAICGFNFGAVYGELGEGFIHVHHLRDLATIGEEYEVDPIADLQPVCPNCHAMLHRTVPAMSPKSLKEVMIGGHV